MSKIVVGEIEGPSTTSNKITIASGSQLDLVGSTGTVTLDAADITAGDLPSARLPIGTVLQVVTATPMTEFTYSNAQGWSAIGPGGTGTDGALLGNAVITPSSASNKILVIYSIGGISNYNGNTPTTRIYRAISGGTSSAPLVATTASNRSAGMTTAPGYASGGTETQYSAGMHFLDSPNTTSEITYTLQWFGRTDSTNFWNYANGQEAGADVLYYGRGITTLTVMEIKG